MNIFKAAILERLDSPLSIKKITCNEPEQGQVFVKILTSGLCGAQLQEIAGLKGNANFLPHLLGHEGCGIVEKIGSAVTKVKVGDKVVVHWKKSDGLESTFPTYFCNGQKIGGGKVTTLSEYSLVSENRMTVVSEDTPNDFCALLGCGLSTALGTINYEVDLKFGESILVLGSGGLGLNLIQAAKLAGAYPIFALDINDKSSLCHQVGASSFVSTVDEIKHLKFDAIIDTTGNKFLIQDTLQLLADSGRYIFVGQNKPNDSIELFNSNHLFGSEGKTIKATQGGNIVPSRDIKKYSNLYHENYIDYKKIITHRFSLDSINDAFDTLRSGNAGRIIIEM
jgi:Zn-dependent alcohol dehydrogenase